MPRLILASQSPRRRELLRRMGVACAVCPSHIPERSRRGEPPARHALRLALAKAESVSKYHPAAIVIAADTIVVKGNIIFGKPRSAGHARRMLAALSGTRHEVLTALALVRRRDNVRFVDLDRAVVTTRRVSPARIRTLARRHQDKAGGYAVQERSDEVVRQVSGSYYTVVGLAVHQLHRLLRLVGIASVDLREPGGVLPARDTA